MLLIKLTASCTVEYRGHMMGIVVNSVLHFKAWEKGPQSRPPKPGWTVRIVQKPMGLNVENVFSSTWD